MVTTDCQVVPIHEQVADLAWPKWTRHAGAEIDGAIDTTTLGVRKHGIDRWQVSIMSAMTVMRTPLFTTEAGQLCPAYPRIAMWPSGDRRGRDLCGISCKMHKAASSLTVTACQIHD